MSSSDISATQILYITDLFILRDVLFVKLLDRVQRIDFRNALVVADADNAREAQGITARVPYPRHFALDIQGADASRTFRSFLSRLLGRNPSIGC